MEIDEEGSIFDNLHDMDLKNIEFNSGAPSGPPKSSARKRKKNPTKEHFTCPFGQCNHQLRGMVNGTLYPEEKGMCFRLIDHDCKYMRRPVMHDSWGVGKKIRCPACGIPIQIISPSEPLRFNLATFVNHLFSHYSQSNRYGVEGVYRKEVQTLLTHSTLNLKEIYTQICVEYIALVWPRMFQFQRGVNYPFQWPEMLMKRCKIVQDITITTRLKKKEAGSQHNLDRNMELFKETYFKEAKDFNYEKEASVIKFALSYDMDFDNLDLRYQISKTVQAAIKKLTSEEHKPGFLVDIQERGLRRGSIQAILLCIYQKDKEAEFQEFLRNEMANHAEHKGEKPRVLHLNHLDVPESPRSLEPRRLKSAESWPWYVALQESGGEYVWKTELKGLQEYICNNKREEFTDLSTHDLLREKCVRNDDEDSKIKGPYTKFKASGGWAKHPGTVLIQLDVRGISNVEVDRGTFDMSAYIRVIFYDPTATKVLPIEDGEKTYKQIYGNKTDLELDGYCVPPLIRTRNAVEGDALREGWGCKAPKMFNPKDHKGIWIQELFLKNTKFHENFQLEDFPFDTQTCAVIFALVHTKSNKSRFNYGGVFEKQKVRPPQFLLPWLGQMKMRAPLKEYQLYKPDVRTYNNLHFVNGARRNQLLIHRTSIRRKFNWYVYDLMLPLGFTGTVSFMTFLMIKIEHRLNFNATLLVIITAFKWFITTRGPRSPETVTLIDRYSTYNFYLVLIIMCGNAVNYQAVNYQGGQTAGLQISDNWRGAIPDENRESSLFTFERALAMVLLMVWIIGHLIICARVDETSSKLFGKRIKQVLLSASVKTRNDINDLSDSNKPVMRGPEYREWFENFFDYTQGASKVKSN
eukprot:CAMPEP_0114508122 /NCGR_PEP_ID=MMETSP0109-20121206/12412_1 /TAXON_ID=29199 /ORGANISM="Chlorarachnion reptans, Strain CCCM449" /LENGTH=860 /DNA_ID=CAMNT_0001686995 /DNA_START=342 /DNA_END=2924 /DNA_ORIENTATION=+